jgi:ribosomal protein S18 acetylase RimI-like enzyme
VCAGTLRPVSEWIIRSCEETDLDQVSHFAAALVRFHAELDPERYMKRDRVQEGYRWYLGKELEKKEVVLLVIARGGEIGGYAYGRNEERDWMRLLDAHGELHDVWVREDLRGTGLAESLVRECIARLEALGAPRVLLNTAWMNERGRRFFEKLGFRPTMLEMTRSRARDARAGGPSA